jgi:hypothetical protein
MRVNSLVGDLTNEIIDFIYSQTRKKNNKRKIKYIIDILTTLLFHDIQPYLYTILAMLFIMFIINCFQFYYYIKLFVDNNSKNLKIITPKVFGIDGTSIFNME